MVDNIDDWPYWPYLPLKGFNRTGVLIDCEYKYRVYLINYYDIKGSLDDVPYVEYNNIHELLKEWRVD